MEKENYKLRITNYDIEMRIKLYILFIYLTVWIGIFSQNRNDSIEEITFGGPEKMPEFRRNKGLEELMEFIVQNLQYPETARKYSIEGRVITQYWIDTLGNTYNHKIVRGVREDLDNEALRIIKLLKYEVPAMQRGKPISVMFTLPIIFDLSGANNLYNQQPIKDGRYGKNNEVAGFFFTLPLEIPFINNISLNKQLNQQNYPSSNFLPVNFGIGLQGHYNRYILTFSYNNTTKKTKNKDNTVDSEYRATSFNLGYNLLPTYRFSLYPYIGFKGVGLSYEFKETIAENASFLDYLNKKTAYKEFSQSQTYIDLGIGFSHQWFYLINFRVGHLFPVGKTEFFNENKIELSNFPAMKYNFYINLTIGLGAIADKNEVRRSPYFRNE